MTNGKKCLVCCHHDAVDDSAIDVTTSREETVIIGIGVDARNVDVFRVDTFFDELQAIAFPQVNVPFLCLGIA